MNDANTGSSSIIARQRERIDLLEEQVRQLKALLRPEGTVSLGVWELSGGLLHHEGRIIALSRSEHFATASILSKHGKIVTRKMIFDCLYADYSFGSLPRIDTIDTIVCTARRKIKAQTGEQPIRTVWGRGYTWQGA